MKISINNQYNIAYLLFHIYIEIKIKKWLSASEWKPFCKKNFSIKHFLFVVKICTFVNNAVFMIECYVYIDINIKET